MGAIVSMMRTVVSFVMNLKAMGEAIFKLFTKFPKDPFGTIIGVITIIFGMIFGLILLLIWLMWTVTGLAWVLMFLYATIVTVIGGILYTVGMFVICTLLAIPYFGLWLIDMPTGGLVVSMMRCENSAGAWYDINQFDGDNGYMRLMPFVCLRPCTRGYTPSMLCCCAKLPSYMPDYCPQQQVYRTYRGMSGALSTQPYAFDTFKPPKGFKRMTQTQRKVIMLGAFRKKMEWYQKCYASLVSYDYLNRHLCHNASQLGLEPEEVVKLCKACRESFCNHKSANLKMGIKASMTGPESEGNFQADAPNNRNASAIGNKSSCERLDALIRNGGLESSLDSSSNFPHGPGVEMLKRVLVVFIVTLCILITLYSLVEAVNALKESQVQA
jgi:hypothetical protein